MPPTQFPNVRQLRRLVKKRHRARFTAMWFLEPIQVWFSYALIRLGLNATQVTVLWFLVALAGYAVTAVGTPLAFIGGALLLYLKTILDGSDGEVARYRKQFVSEEEDLETFIHGVYLDKAFHIIEKPLWGLSLAFGLYRMTGHGWIFAAGVSVAIFHTFSRHNAVLLSDIPRRFEARVGQLFSANGAFGSLGEKPSRKDPIAIRLVDRLHLYMKNGKRFNLFVLCCALFDLVALALGWPARALLTLVVAAGIISPLMMTYVITRTIRTKTLILRACENRIA